MVPFPGVPGLKERVLPNLALPETVPLFMVIGVLSVELGIGQSQSLKEKRQALKSLKDRLRHSFNVSIAETAYQDLWQRAELTIVGVGTETAGLNRMLSLAVKMVEQDREIILNNYEIQIL